MAHPSPLHALHESGGALFGAYGPPESPVSIVQAFDPVEVEYAAIRRHAAIIDLPARAAIAVTGADRAEFLHRMITQDVKGLPPHTCAESFWLNRKGRIDADLLIANLPDHVLLDLDVFALDRTLSGLGAFIITEDCALDDRTAQTHRLGLHGPAAAAVLGRYSTPVSGFPVADLARGQVSVVSIAATPVTVARRDSTGEIGLELFVPVESAQRVYEALSTPWSERGPTDAAAPQTDRARRIGWHAYNIARIEAGAAMYMLDFGPDSLPHEAGGAALASRVSFKKGCYLGQEIVARMQSLGHPKQKLVGLRVEASPPAPASATPAQAVTGTQVVETDAPGATVVGAVTSSAFSPMNSGASICLAMIKHSHTRPGTKVFLQTDGTRLPATVQEGPSFLPRR